MLRLVLLCVLALCVLPTEAAAQAHPCDTVTPPPVVTKTGFTVGICHNGKDDDVPAQPVVLTAMKVFIDGVLVKTVTLPTPTGAANAAGLSYYTTSGVVASKGPARSLTVTFVSADGESDLSTAYTFSVVGGKPSKPVGARVEPRN